MTTTQIPRCNRQLNRHSLGVVPIAPCPQLDSILASDIGGDSPIGQANPATAQHLALVFFRRGPSAVLGTVVAHVTKSSQMESWFPRPTLRLIGHKPFKCVPTRVATNAHITTPIRRCAWTRSLLHPSPLAVNRRITHTVGAATTGQCLHVETAARPLCSTPPRVVVDGQNGTAIATNPHHPSAPFTVKDGLGVCYRRQSSDLVAFDYRSALWCHVIQSRPFRFGMVRTRGGVWTCVTSVEAQAMWIREALA